MDVRLVNELLSRGADADGCNCVTPNMDICGDDPPFLLSFLHLACGAVYPNYTSATLVEALIKHGAGVNQRACWMEDYCDEYNGMTPLDMATWATCNRKKEEEEEKERRRRRGGGGEASRECAQCGSYKRACDFSTNQFLKGDGQSRCEDCVSVQFLENQIKTVQILLENGANPETVMPRLKGLKFRGIGTHYIYMYVYA